MKLVATTAPDWRPFPHVIVRNDGRNRRYSMAIANASNEIANHATHSFCRPGMLGRDGSLTPAGRRTILDAFAAKAAHGPRACIVWGPRECTFVLQDGSLVEGTKPPTGDVAEPEDYDRIPVQLMDCFHIAVPPGGRASHVCIRRLGREQVEVASGAPLYMGRWDEYIPEGLPNPFNRHVATDGYFDPPAVFRGVEATFTEDGEIFGPVQPDGVSTILVKAWPDLVLEACEAIAGTHLPATTAAAVLRALEPAEAEMLHVGALAA